MGRNSLFSFAGHGWNGSGIGRKKQQVGQAIPGYFTIHRV
jgi:hypothetical protein